MKLLHLQQGTQEWIDARAKCECASDAPAVLGCSPYKTRAQLLREKHTGVPAEINIATQNRFDNGHRAEALARPLAEEFIGAELFPAVCVSDDGTMLASMDGLTLDETTGFEHKALNAELRAIFASGTDDMDGSLLPLMHRVQMEMQFMVTGCERTLFMCSEWTAEGELVEEHHCWYYPDTALQAQIIAAWRQFRADLAAYVVPESVDPAPVGKAPETLPALRIEVTGQVTASNLSEFKATALAAIRSVNRELRTDADFADAAKAVAWCSDVESRLKAAKEHALSQTASIDALFKAIDDISTEARAVRLDLDKLVTRRKVEVKEQAVSLARKALDDHIATLNAELAPMRLLSVTADFAGAIKGLRTVASMQDALDTTLAGAKIAADAQARVIRGNLAKYKAKAAGMEFLFADLGQIVHKAADDFEALVSSRIATHQAAEAERERKRVEAEQQRIAAEAERLAAKKIEDARVAALAEQRRQDAAAESVRVAAAAAPAPTIAAEQAELIERGRVIVDDIITAEILQAAVIRPNTVAPRQDEPATLKLGDINARLAPLKLDAAGMAELGVSPARTEGAAKLYRESDFERLLCGIAKHVDVLQGVPA
jgi:putative phage-type endonuclease